MKKLNVIMSAALILSFGTAFAAEPVQSGERQMQMVQAQERNGAEGEKYHQLMEQKREQSKYEYRHQNRIQVMEGRGARMQERMMNRNR